MTNKLQFGKWLAALGICAALALPAFAQRGRSNWQQNPNRPPKPAQAAKQPRQQEKQQRQQEKQAQREAQRNPNRPPQTNPETHPNNPNRPNGPTGDARANNNPNRPPNAYTPPPAKKFDSLNSQEKQRALNNYKNYEKRTPAEKQQMQEAQKNWQGLTDEQRTHIRRDIAPKWQQLPVDRQRAIRSRLNVLKNMPESARNQHLNDPNFTRGMNEDDQAMLRDLSHLHVGGAPEPEPHE